MIKRWQIYQWNGTAYVAWTFEANPSAMDSPYIQHDTAPAPASVVDGRMRGMREHTTPWVWGWSGRIRHQAFHDALQSYYDSGALLYVKDHYDRIWKIRFTNFDPTPRRTHQNTAWRFDYSVKVLVYSGPLTEVPASP